MNSRIKLREATIADLAILQHWDEQDHITASDPNDEWDWDIELNRTPPWREQLIAELDGTPIGFLQIIDPAKEESRYWGDIAPNLRAIDIWIGEKENLGKGYGSDMMCLALQRCFSEDEVSAVLIDPLESNVRAHKFYERLGFNFVEKRTFGSDACFVYKIEKKDWKNPRSTVDSPQ